MPQRFLRPGITNSALWNGISFPAQSLFIRLITLVDDYGRYDGRTSVIWSHSFAVWNEQNPQLSVDLQQTEKLLQECAATSLVDIYEAEGKRVLQICQWQERVRDNVKEKWPKKPNAATPEKVAAHSSTILPPSPSSSSSSSGVPPAVAPSQKLSAADTVKFDGELKRITGRLSKLGKPGDYASNSTTRKEIETLTKRLTELRTILGVTA